MKAIQKTKIDKYRRKEAERQMRSIERIYGKDVGFPGTVEFETFLIQNGFGAFNDLLKLSPRQRRK